jgi:hypothetical protein
MVEGYAISFVCPGPHSSQGRPFNKGTRVAEVRQFTTEGAHVWLKFISCFLADVNKSMNDFCNFACYANKI